MLCDFRGGGETVSNADRHDMSGCLNVQDVASKRKLAKSKLPQMSMADPLRKWYNFPSGSVLKLVYNMSHLGTAEYLGLRYKAVK